MKDLLFLCGPNGIGKTTICRSILSRLPGSAYVDSDGCRMMNPFVLDDTTIPTIAKNISGLIGNYLACDAVHTVIFSYGFHGRRKEVFDRVMRALPIHRPRFVPFHLVCGEEENMRRIRADGRTTDRGALEISRSAFSDIEYPKIDITDLSADEAATRIILQAGLKAYSIKFII